jgi:tetratricopeptide (TPR) repeat protein
MTKSVTMRAHCAALTIVILCGQVIAAAQDPKSIYARALELDGQGNHAAALSLLWEAAGLAPRDPEIQNSLGEALDRLGALDAAIDAFGRAVAARPAFAKAENNLILTLVKAGRGPEAVTRARARVRAAPDDPSTHFTLGLAQSEQDVTQALESFRRAIELAPRHTLARYNLALVLKRADRATDAIAELQRAIGIEPRPECYYTLGTIYWQQGDVDRAVSALRAAIGARPGYADAHYTLGTVLKARREWNAAAAELRRAIELRPDLWSAHYTLAQVLQQSGDEQGAGRQLAEAERLRQRSQREQEAGVWTAVGIAKLDSGDYLAAVDSFRRATTLVDTYAPAHYQMGRALQRLGESEAAQSAFARARQLNPSLLPPGRLQ